ncbi:MAG: HNH endonuclease, partial [Mycobacterium sp.]|nr:HNH endonuclease [Mycobacterium sp.]
MFQRLAATGEDTERAYEEQWRQLESGFWEQIVSQGRIRQPRISLFFNHWLIATTGDEVVTTEVFRAFKRYLEESEVSLAKLLAEIVTQAGNYQALIELGESTGDVDRLGMFMYRTNAMGMEVTKPFAMWLTDPVEGPCPTEEIPRAVGCVESWLVRRMLVGATTKAYNRVLLDLLDRLRSEPRERAGTVVETFFRNQTSFTSYWPGDDEVRKALTEVPLYRKVPRARLRLLLEAIEDHLRGFTTPGAVRAGEQQVARSAYTVEHVMPQEWVAHWPLGGTDPVERDRLVHTLGNLTLLTQKFNSSVSNAKWTGTKGKRAALDKHSVLLMNRDLVRRDDWTDEEIRSRTHEFIDIVLKVWPVPEGHEGRVVS